MRLRTFFIGRAIGFLVLLALLGIAWGLSALGGYLQKGSVDEAAYEPQRASLEGEYVCLAKEGGVPETPCVPGLVTDAGERYAIDLYLMSQEHRPLSAGERISANGVLTPIERLSTDHWVPYNLAGIFSITDSLHVE